MVAQLLRQTALLLIRFELILAFPVHPDDLHVAHFIQRRQISRDLFHIDQIDQVFLAIRQCDPIEPVCVAQHADAHIVSHDDPQLASILFAVMRTGYDHLRMMRPDVLQLVDDSLFAEIHGMVRARGEPVKAGIRRRIRISTGLLNAG